MMMIQNDETKNKRDDTFRSNLAIFYDLQSGWQIKHGYLIITYVRCRKCWSALSRREVKLLAELSRAFGLFCGYIVLFY